MNQGLVIYIAAGFLSFTRQQSNLGAKSTIRWREWLQYQFKKSEKVRTTEIIKGSKGSSPSIGKMVGSMFDVPDREVISHSKTYGELNPEPTLKLNERSISNEYINEALNLLVEFEMASVIPYPIAGDQYSIVPRGVAKIANSILGDQLVEIFEKHKKLGDDWLKEAINNLYDNPALYNSDNTYTPIPASDRIVELNHNLPEYKEIETEVKRLKEEALSTGSGNSLSPKEEAAISDLDAGLSLLQRTTCRAQSIKETLIAGLETLKEEIKKEGFKQAAKTLIAQIITFIGLG